MFVLDTSFIFPFQDLPKEEIYTVPAIWAEILAMASPEVLKKTKVTIKDCNKYNHFVPAALFWRFMQDVEVRIKSGLKVAEKKIEDKKKLREEYRDKVRSGILDGAADFELILLAKDLDCAILTRDKGMIKFARELGIKIYEK